MIGTKLPAATCRNVYKEVDGSGRNGRRSHVVGVPTAASMRNERLSCSSSAYFKNRSTFFRDVSFRAPQQPSVRVGATMEFSSVASGEVENVKFSQCKISTEYKTVYGDSLMVVGSTESLGGWWPAYGLEMTWTEGHIWTCEFDVPFDEEVYFKFILKTRSGDLWWEPSSNRKIGQQLGLKLDIRGQFGVEDTKISVCDEKIVPSPSPAEEPEVKKKGKFGDVEENVNEFYRAITKGLASSAYMESKMTEASDYFTKPQEDIVYRPPFQGEAKDLDDAAGSSSNGTSANQINAEFTDLEAEPVAEIVMPSYASTLKSSSLPVEQVVPDVLPDTEEAKSTSTALAPVSRNSEVFAFLEKLAETLASQLTDIDPQKQLQRVKLQATATISNLRQVAESASEGLRSFKESANNVSQAVRNAKSREDINKVVMSLLVQTKTPPPGRILSDPDEKE